jgi:hypothetical protein
MANRDLTANVLSEIIKNKTFPFFLISVHFDETDPVLHIDNTVRLTSAYNDIDWGGETYDAVGHFLGFTPIQETGENRISRVRVNLSAVDQTRISEMFNHEFLNRPLRIYLGFIDATDYSIISDPVLILNGLMSQPIIQEDVNKGTSMVSVQVVDIFESFNTRPGRHTNSDEQKFFFPGDLGFEYVATIPQSLSWGRKD